jgi:hypothetical protein
MFPFFSFSQNIFNNSGVNLDKIIPKEYRIVDLNIGVFNDEKREYTVIIIEHICGKQKVVGVFTKDEYDFLNLYVENSKFFYFKSEYFRNDDCFYDENIEIENGLLKISCYSNGRNNYSFTFKKNKKVFELVESYSATKYMWGYISEHYNYLTKMYNERRVEFEDENNNKDNWKTFKVDNMKILRSFRIFND